MSDAAVEALIAPDGALFFGRPETVADKIVALHDAAGHRPLRDARPHVGHAATMRSIELFGTEVAPLVRKELAARDPGLRHRARLRRGPLASSPLLLIAPLRQCRSEKGA